MKQGIKPLVNTWVLFVLDQIPLTPSFSGKIKKTSKVEISASRSENMTRKFDFLRLKQRLDSDRLFAIQ